MIPFFPIALVVCLVSYINRLYFLPGFVLVPLMIAGIYFRNKILNLDCPMCGDKFAKRGKIGDPRVKQCMHCGISIDSI